MYNFKFNRNFCSFSSGSNFSVSDKNSIEKERVDFVSLFKEMQFHDEARYKKYLSIQTSSAVTVLHVWLVSITRENCHRYKNRLLSIFFLIFQHRVLNTHEATSNYTYILSGLQRHLDYAYANGWAKKLQKICSSRHVFNFSGIFGTVSFISYFVSSKITIEIAFSRFIKHIFRKRI